MRISNHKQLKKAIASAIACGMPLALSSCAIPDLRPAAWAPSTPPVFAAASNSETVSAAPQSEENSAQLGIGQFFSDPILSGLIEQGLANNRELKILDEEVQIASNEVLARRGAYLPFVTVGAEASLDKHSLYTPLGAVEENLPYEPGEFFPEPLPNFLLGFNLFWPLDIWREFRNARDAAIQRYCAAQEQRNAFVTRLVADIAESYYSLMALDKRLETLNLTIELQEKSLQVAQAKKDAGRDTALPVQRFQAEVRKNQSERQILRQEIVEIENRINFLLNRYPQPVERNSDRFLELQSTLQIGVPAQLLLNRPDIRQAERELAAAGLDVLVARARFFPRVDITAGVGYEAFNMKYLFNTPEALIYNVAGNLVAPLINKKAIQAEYKSANARQLQALYNYQRLTLEAFTEVINRISMVQNYAQSIEIKKQQLEALQASVETASSLFQSARAEYVEVLLAQRDLMEARMVLIETKKEQLSAVVNAYQALGGGDPTRDSTSGSTMITTPLPPETVQEAPAPALVPPLPALETPRPQP